MKSNSKYSKTYWHEFKNASQERVSTGNAISEMECYGEKKIDIGTRPENGLYFR
jgi:hypothetical protein